MKKTILPILMLAASLSSCVDTKKNQSDNAMGTVEPEATEVITYKAKELHLAQNVIENQETPSYKIDFEIAYAQEETELAQEINKTITSSVFHTDGLEAEQAIQHMADSIANEFTQDLREGYEPDEESFKNQYVFEWVMTGEPIEFPLPNVQGYTIRREVFQGGPHGSHDIFYLNIDRKTGKRVTASDVFVEGSIPEVVQLMKQKLLTDNQCETEEELQDKTGITLLGELFVENNFLLDTDGILFIFNPYEIAPYSSGTISIRLGFDVLKNYLKPDFQQFA